MASLADQFLDDLASSDDESTKDINETDGEINQNLDTKPASAPNPETSRLDALVRRVREGSSSLSQENNLLHECVQAIADARMDAADAHARLREIYSPRFPELSTLLPSPREYKRAVRVLENNIEDAKGLKEFLSAGTVITIEVAASASKGRLLREDELTHVNNLHDMLTRLEDAEQALLHFVQIQTETIAPNLSVIVGGAVAGQLITEAGSLDAFTRIPGCNVKVLGKVQKANHGGSTVYAGRHEGFVYSCPLVLSLPPSMRKRGADMVANKAALAGRVDAARESRDGALGQKLREAIESCFERWQEPPPARTAKPLPVPDEIRKKHRAGKRARRNKELYGVSEMRKQANRVKFGQPEEHYGNDIESGGLGLLAAEGSGKVRIMPKKTNSVDSAANRRLAREARRRSGPSAAMTAGLTTTVEGIELGTKTPAPGGVGLGSLDAREGTQSVYFSSKTGFFGAKKETAEK